MSNSLTMQNDEQEVIFMKKIIGLSLVLCILMGSTVLAAPLPKISKICFLPNGEPYHYYHFGDEWFDSYRYNGQLINSGGIVSNYLPEGVDYDGFIRYMVTIKGSDYLTNQRFIIDNKHDIAYPQENMFAPFFVKLVGQIGDSVVDDENKIVTIKYPKGKQINTTDIYFNYTDYGCAKYKVFNGYSTGRSGIVYNNGYILSNKIDNLDEIYNNSSLHNSIYVNEKNEELKKIDALIDIILEEKIDFTKATYMYLMVGGHSRYIIKYKVNAIQSDEPENGKKAYTIPSKVEFDKHPWYSANIIVNILNAEKAPQQILINGKTIEQGRNYAVNSNYLVISQDYLNTFKAGETVACVLLFNDKSEVKIDIQINDTASEKYKPIFDDVGFNEPYWAFIQSLYDKNIVKGDGENFYPNSKITKAEFCVMLARALNIEQKQGSNWYDWAIDGLYQFDILPDLQQNETVSHNQAAKALIKAIYMRHQGKKSIFGSLSTYPGFDRDNKSNNIYSYDAITNGELMIEHDSFLYTIQMVDPALSTTDGVMTRADCAKAVYQFIELSDLFNDDKRIEAITGY